jgi:23S rRNA (guanosine2251-2'-O)-methyltransferase
MSRWIYGFHAVEAAVKREPAAVQVLWLQSGRKDKRAQGIETLAHNQGVALEWVSRERLDGVLEGAGRHQGIAAQMIGGQSQTTLDERSLLALVAQAASPLVLVLDGVTDPHNLGACLRSADAAGVTAVVVPKDRSADLGPTVTKVACGAAESVPFARVTNLSRTLEKLKEAGLWLVGTTGEAETSLYDQDLTGSLCLIMGAEGEGMRRLTQDACDFLVKLPMAGSVESLNVSVATGVCLFEAVRQRR